MQFSKITFILGALPFTFAAYGAADASSASSGVTSSSTTTTSPSDPTHTILVGAGGQLTFSPNETKADVNTTLEFHFYAKTHSVAQAAFASPCKGSGFFSGPITTTGTEANASVFSVLINDTKPIWFYCGYPGHCEGGMVGAVNVNTTDNAKTLAKFSLAAKALDSDATKNPEGIVGGTLAPLKAQSGSGTSSATGTAASASATGSSAADVTTVGWITFAGAVAVAGLLGM
ncbi:hypothetical protein BOTCAL_0411g00070 [Botryotinia calthae]|uniref:Blue (type 1) copper domain-containing protein n=1 Tax=Botryotinia calthae TaxID=38488 RepID=A0A4Y8CSD3_9HELO|nr:hypothetical protein BOTCAL_0411g00070 [Botryotinia calthae]